MSRLLQELEASKDPHFVRRSIPSIPMRMMGVKEDFSREPVGFGQSTRYSIRVTLGDVVYIDDDLVRNGSDAIGLAVASVKRGIVEEVFGEFRGPLEKLQMLILEGNQRDALVALDDLRTQMFS